ncbi:metalloproteinase inhibitor 1-like [Asterias amurensis]|uniref:metalloproteinase inhibitor 1-like n=1 Tax=Asterias amurensis TaxID=7602 RepID=UPI003AB8FA8C
MYTTMWLVFVLVAVIYSRETDGCSCSYAHPQVQFCNAAFVIKASVISREYIYRPTEKPMTEPADEFTSNPELTSFSSVYDESGAFVLANLAEVQPEKRPPAFLSPQALRSKKFISPSFPQRPFKIEYTVKVEKVFKGDNLIIERTLAKVYTPADEGICGLTSLNEDTSYVMAGSHYDNELRINLCNWVVPYKSLTRINRRGLKLMYKQSCGDCTIATCYGQTCKFGPPGDDFCMFDAFGGNGCQAQHSICTRSKKSCKWQRNRDYRKCEADSEQQGNSVMP